MIDGVVERIWPGGVEAVEPLGGGITNRNFTVRVGGERFVLRIGGKDTELLGIDRNAEHAASLVAAALGVGPEVVCFLEPEGYLVTRFLAGEVGQVSPPEAAALLRRFHGGPAIPGRFDAFRVVETYAATAAGAGVPLPPAYAEATAIANRIEARRGPYAPTPCHNDLLAANFIRGERLWIVDWEYAGMGDPAFDLANFAVNNGLDEIGDRTLLDAYGGGDARIHVLMRYMSDFREAMWGVVQQAISNLDFDFASYASEHFERLERAAAEPRFHHALT
jgi:aminoglycoside phosphotransferase (APT) family kinase protein